MTAGGTLNSGEGLSGSEAGDMVYNVGENCGAKVMAVARITWRSPYRTRGREDSDRNDGMFVFQFAITRVFEEWAVECRQGRPATEATAT